MRGVRNLTASTTSAIFFNSVVGDAEGRAQSNFSAGSRSPIGPFTTPGGPRVHNNSVTGSSKLGLVLCELRYQRMSIDEQSLGARPHIASKRACEQPTKLD